MAGGLTTIPQNLTSFGSSLGDVICYDEVTPEYGGPSHLNIIGVLTKGGVPDTVMHTQRRSLEDEGGDWRKAARSQGMLKTASKPSERT